MLAPLEAKAGIRRGDAIHATFVAHGAANSLARNKSLTLAPRDVVAGADETLFSKLLTCVVDLLPFLACCCSSSLLCICPFVTLPVC